jgi:glycosyltransferase involved in cell wall biosynthesis
MGRLVPVKQPQRVLDLAEEFPDVNFIIAGTGILEIELRKSNAQNIFFVGWVDPAMFWPAVDIALLTSENEAQPIVLIEAAMTGLPSIAENVGSVSEVVLNEKTGLLVNNESERISQLRRLEKNEEFRKDLGNRARLYVEERFGVSRFISEHLEAYKDIL